MIDQEREVGFHSTSLLLLSCLLTELPNKERVQAMGLDFQGDEGEEFSQLLRIPHGRFIPPFLASHQRIVAPHQFMSKLLVIFRQGGFKFEQSTGERPDHIGVILEFLALLESKGQNPSDELQALITEPFKKFAIALNKATEHPLYRKVAEALTEMVEVKAETDG